MNKLFMKTTCALLSMTLLTEAIPILALAEEIGNSNIFYPTGDYNGLILEFSNLDELENFRDIYGGSPLGGNMMLTDSRYNDAVRYEKMAAVESVTYNYIVSADSFAEDYGIVPSESNNAGNDYFWKHIGELADTAELSGLYTVRVGVLDTGIDEIQRRFLRTVNPLSFNRKQTLNKKQTFNKRC